MNARDPNFVPAALPDIQSSPDLRDIPIQRVGVKAITHPLLVATPKGPQPTVATIDMDVALPADQKGTHMSRFLEVLQRFHEPLSPETVTALMQAMLSRLQATAGSIDIRFPYFVMKAAPVSGVESLMDYCVRLVARAVGGHVDVLQEVQVPATSLCPCSKEISEYGAHNQRSQITIGVEFSAAGRLTVEQQIRVAEDAASCELWGLLKRPDEKFVTERAYDNPKFVEDMVRDIAVRLEADARVASYRVASENFESIHNHSAYAELARDKRTSAQPTSAGA